MHSDREIAAVANYVTARFGSAPSHVTASKGSGPSARDRKVAAAHETPLIVFVGSGSSVSAVRKVPHALVNPALAYGSSHPSPIRGLRSTPGKAPQPVVDRAASFCACNIRGNPT